MDRKDFSNPTDPIAEGCYMSTGSSQRGTRTKRHRKPQLVDFHAFKLDYWPKFPGRLTKHIPIELVFAEIMGVIKGSASSRISLEPLHREEYSTRSCRLAPAFARASERAQTKQDAVAEGLLRRAAGFRLAKKSAIARRSSRASI